MRFGFWTSNAQPWDDVAATASHAATTGWDGIWFADHFMPFTGDPTGPIHEAWAVLSGLAATVPDIRIGPLVSGNTYRHPAVLAKMAATADHISGGRIVLGLGAGWQENEHEAYGIELGSVRDRLDRFEEACRLIVALRDSAGEGTDGATVTGGHYTLTSAPLSPAPVGRLPLMVGGGGEKRTLRITAQYADEWNVWGEPDLLAHKMSVLDAHCADVGRDPAAIERSAVALMFLSTDTEWLDGMRDRDVGRPKIVGTPDEVSEVVDRYRSLGVHELIVPDFTMGPLDRRHDTMDLFITEVAPNFR